MNETIRGLLVKFGNLPVSVDQLQDDSDLYTAGLSSFASVQVMLGIEEAFDVEFPDTMLNRRSFASIAAIEGCVRLLTDREAAEGTSPPSSPTQVWRPAPGGSRPSPPDRPTRSMRRPASRAKRWTP